jgi:type IV fimbrial biogenesis protein FimT
MEETEMDFRSTNTTGFTLVELLISLSIASILMASAAPSFQSFLERSRMSTSTNAFISHLHLARAEAINRKRRVILCPSSNGLECIADYTQWARGYILFVDEDDNRERNDGEQLIRYVQDEGNGITIYSSSNYRKVVAYYPTGMAYGFNTTIRFCARTSESINRAVIISATGRPRLSKSMSDGGEIECT